MTSTITSSVQIEVMSAATAADRVANSYSVSGSGVTTTDGTTAGVVGGLGTATNGVNAFTQLQQVNPPQAKIFNSLKYWKAMRYQIQQFRLLAQ